MKPLLLFHNKLGDSSQLLEGRLLLIDSESNTIKNVYRATSGSAGWQEHHELAVRGKGSIPPQSDVNIPHYTVATKPIPMPKLKGVEGNFYKIDPHLVRINGQQRGDFGIHRDANVPGSAGCVVLTTIPGWEGFQLDMRNLATSGVQKVPLLVSYIR
ncbi:hypothetical protein [Iningainema tapete]|uniref:hypothetical protein n=1 Tax=Iningainema tapete TaxID=2806730 RepID=UPI00192D547B|nr:hypothetical protein [Iningainema tapete]